VALEVVQSDRGHSEGVGEPVRRARAHEQCAGKPGPFRIGDRANVGDGEPGTREDLASERQETTDMVPRGELWHDPAVLGVHGRLGMERVREEPAIGVVQRDAGLVTRGFDAQDDHGKLRQVEGVAGRATSLI
jgi:hypothetical protein